MPIGIGVLAGSLGASTKIIAIRFGGKMSKKQKPLKDLSSKRELAQMRRNRIKELRAERHLKKYGPDRRPKKDPKNLCGKCEKPTANKDAVCNRCSRNAKAKQA